MKELNTTFGTIILTFSNTDIVINWWGI